MENESEKHKITLLYIFDKNDLYDFSFYKAKKICKKYEGAL